MIIVCSLREAQRQVQMHKASHVVSILGPDMAHESFASIETGQHLRLTFHDVASPVPGLSVPQSHDMTQLLSFLGNWNQQAPLIIHCWAGISRSTAAGFIATCLFRPNEDEMLLARQLREASPSATPNPMLVALADEALGRQGRMRRAIQAIGRGADAFEGTPFQLAVRPEQDERGTSSD